MAFLLALSWKEYLVIASNLPKFYHSAAKVFCWDTGAVICAINAWAETTCFLLVNSRTCISMVRRESFVKGNGPSQCCKGDVTMILGSCTWQSLMFVLHFQLSFKSTLNQFKLMLQWMIQLYWRETEDYNWV